MTKRKLSPGAAQADGPTKAKKKSPLFNQPQNYYAPPDLASMTKDELSEWRKEQRRRRNRESAAASRAKNKERIEELEGEVNSWKTKYAALEDKMRCMERHIEFLMKMNSNSPQEGQVPPPPTPVVSRPTSPPRSPQQGSSKPTVAVPHAVTSSSVPPPPVYSSNPNSTHLFPPLLSEAKDDTLVEKKDEAAAAATMSTQESREHLKQISRQA